MIRKSDIMNVVKNEKYTPSTEIELYNKMGLHEEDVSMKYFCETLRDLAEEGKIIYTKKNRIMTPVSLGMYVGILDVTRKGFGFVKSIDNSFDDLFIGKENLNGAAHGDKVVAYLIEHKKDYFKKHDNPRRKEGYVEKILVHATQRVVGTLEAHGSFGFVIPDDKKHSFSDIFVSCGNFHGAQHNDKVVVEIIRNATKEGKPEGNITKVICNKDDRFADILSVIEQYELPEKFPDKVMKEVSYLGTEVSEEDINHREDFRDKFIFTIDGPYAKDLDDAISLEYSDNGNFILGVHIADVSHYVKDKSKLDKEALKRGTSVYLVDKVIPMLPPELSNGLCSLHPYTDKLTLSVMMEIDYKGNVINHKIVESVITSKRRFTYQEVTDILLDEKIDLSDETTSVLKGCETLMSILRQKRFKRGALDLDLPEADVKLNAEGEVVDIGIEPRTIANKMIEEFMIVTNETVAEQFNWLQMPFLYRVHEIPDGEKVNQFAKLAKSFGYTIKGDFDNLHPKTLQKLLRKIEGKEESSAISNYMLRSFKHARYCPDELGHFGLASEFYSHFTSPIRRYPDLQIHRIIKLYLHGKLRGRMIEKMTNEVEWSAEQSSNREKIAEKAERDVDKIYQCKFMERFIGEEFEGTIMSLTKIGMYVQIKDIIDGLVKFDTIAGDNFAYDEESFVAKGINTDRVFKLGQKVKIKVDRVDIDLREISFVLVPDEE